MRFGTLNNAGNDTTILQAAPYSSINKPGGPHHPGIQRGSVFVALAHNPPPAPDVPDPDPAEAITGHGMDAFSAGVAGRGWGFNALGVVGIANNGPYCRAVYGQSQNGLAGRFIGMVFKTGGGFMIDHPSDPENRYLCHSFVESPDMLNVYSGNTVTDDEGDAVVTLPPYFADLNKDVTYQLTVIEQFAQAMVSREIDDTNAFRIKTDRPGVKVSWQVTGIRKDAWAERNRIAVEQDKPDHERGTYLHPGAHGKPESQGTDYEVETVFQRGESPRSG